MKEKMDEMIRENNEKRKLLTKENREYYECFVVYIRSSAGRDERATEELLLELLDHLLEAQKEGKRAEEVFGKNPKELADEMIESLPKQSLKSKIEYAMELIFTLFGWFLTVWGIGPLVQQKDPTIYSGSVIVSILFLLGGFVLLIYLVLFVMKKKAFQALEKKRWTTGLLGGVTGVLFMLSFLFILAIEPFGPTFQVTYYTPFGLGCFFLLASYLFKKIQN